jgi:predicted transposase YbfD/YdcC
VSGKVKIDEKSNEITAIPEWLKILDIQGFIISIDTIGSQKK